MAESFKNYINTFKVSESNSGIVIIPNALAGSNSTTYKPGSTSKQTREEGSSCQIHSIYITVQNSPSSATTIGTDTSTQVSTAAQFDVYIEDTLVSGTQYSVVNAVFLLDHTTYFIDKNITLTPTQRLGIRFPAPWGTNNTTSKNKVICVSASCVEI